MTKLAEWLVVSLVLLGISLGALVYKARVLGYPLAPEQGEATWTIEARLRLLPESGPVTVSLVLPDPVPGYARLEESFISRNFGRAVVANDGGRVVEWTVRRLRETRTLYYRGVFYADPAQPGWTDVPPYPDPPELDEPHASALDSIVEDIRARSANIQSFTQRALESINQPNPGENVQLFVDSIEHPDDRVRVIQTVLAAARIPSALVHGIRLSDERRRAERVSWLAVHDGRRWQYFDPVSGRRGLPEEVFLWWRGDRSAVSVDGAALDDLRLSVRRNDVDALSLADQRSKSRGSVFSSLSLQRLPVESQAVYGVLLMVPLGALIIVVLRNLVGVRTFGTFMPVLIALAFRDTGLAAGVMLFSAVVAGGLIIRFYLEHLRLLLVPRLAAVLTIVVLLMVATTLLSNALGVEVGLSVTLFPMVIMAMTIERMSVVWEERGGREAIRDGVGSLAVAAIAFLVMDIEHIKHLTFVFPEVLLAELAVVLMLGRYTGYRLSELGRFRKVVDFSGSRSKHHESD